MQVESNSDPIYANDANSSLSYDDPISNDYIKIYVFQPRLRIRHIKLKSQESISVLGQLYPTDSIYLFNGQLLDIKKTFFDYNISNENKIVLLSSSQINSNPGLIDKWIKLTSDKDNFEYRIGLNINKLSRIEIAKIRDLKFKKLETKRKHFRSYYDSKMMNQDYFDMKLDEEIINNIKNTNLNINSNKPISPSFDPLPILW